MESRLARAILAAVFAISCTYNLNAQTSGQISGHVVDTTGATVADAKITLINAETNASRTTVTTGSGDYTFPEVPPGHYKLEASHADFKTDTTQDVELQVQQSLRQDFTLQVGQVTQSVTVEATGALLQSDNPTLGTVVPTQTLSEMPLNSRNYLGLVAVPRIRIRFPRRRARRHPAKAANGPTRQFPWVASASCTTTTPSTESTIPMSTLIASWCSLRWMPFRK